MKLNAMPESYLAKHIGKQPWSSDEITAAAARLWRQNGVALIPLAEITNDLDRQAVTNIAERLYGKRG